MNLSTLELVAAAVTVAAIWPLMHIKASPTAGTEGSQGDGTGTPDRPGARRPETECPL